MKTRLEYKGYIAEFRYDIDEQRIVGRVVNTADRISFHAKSSREVAASFRNAIDTYLELLDEMNVEPSPINISVTA